MGKLDDIRNKLQAGSTTKQLVEQGYAKSSVHHVAKKLEKLQPSPATSPVPDEIQELRHQKEIMKLKKEIAEIEAGKEKLPDRVGTLESRLSALESRSASSHSVLRDAEDTALFHAFIYAHSLMRSHLEKSHKVEVDAADIEREVRELKEYCSAWVEKQIEKTGT